MPPAAKNQIFCNFRLQNEKFSFFLILQLQPWDLAHCIRNLIREKNPLKIVKFAFINISVVKKQVEIRISVPMLYITFLIRQGLQGLWGATDGATEFRAPRFLVLYQRRQDP